MTDLLLYDLNAQRIDEWHRWAEQESLAKLVAPGRPFRQKLADALQRFTPVVHRRSVAARTA